MARPKRMGAYNALDELLPGPSPRPRLEPVPDPPPAPRGGHRSRGRNALDELLPGPGGPDAGDGVDWGSPRAWLEPVADPGRPAGGGRQHLGAWNPLDDLPSQRRPATRPGGVRGTPTGFPGESAPRTAKSRLTLRLPDDLVETARDAVARLAGTPEETTLTTLAERGLRAELERLAAAHNHGRPFPRRRRGRQR
jgi:hypothetical protein